MTGADFEATRNELTQHGLEALSFLQTRTARPPRVKRDAWLTIVPYVFVKLTFELHIDWRERDTSLLVCRTVNGRRPPGYYTHEGRHMRMHLAKAIEEFGDDENKAALPQLRRLAGTNGYESMRNQITFFGETLSRCVDTLLNRADEIFPD